MRPYLAASAATIALCLLQAPLPAQAAPADDENAGADAGIAEIVVTAQHRTENAQNVPISVSAISGDALKQSNVSSLQDLAGAVPSLVVSKSISYGLAPISIRGLGGPAGGGSPFANQPVAVYVDGVYVPALGQSVSDFLDLDTVQVLRGPQGTLYGRNSTSGAILLTGKRPSNELSGEGRIGYASFDEFKISGALNLPLIDDMLAVRAAIGHNSGGNWAQNSVDSREFGGGRSTSGRISLRYTPDDHLTVDLIADHSTGFSRPATLQLSTAVPVFRGPTLGTLYTGNPFVRRADYAQARDGREVQIVADQFTRTKSTDMTMLVDWELGDLTLTSISGYRNFRVSGTQDVSPFTVPPATTGINSTNQHQESYSQELRLASSDRNPFKWTLGLFYFHQDTDAVVNLRNLQGGPPVATLPGPVFAGRPTGTAATFTGTQSVDSYAAFFDATYQISDRFSVTGGIRYSRDEKDAGIHSLVQKIAPSALGTLGPSMTLSDAACPSATISCRKSFENVSPRVVLNFKPADDHMLYASFSKGFNSGGFNMFGNVANPTDLTNPLENTSEKITSYEIGAKNDLFDRRLRLNLSAFSTDYSDLQIRQAVFTGGVALVNVPKSRVRGIELESIIKPVERLTLTLNGSYLDAKIREGRLAALSSTIGSIPVGQNVTVILEDVSGNRLTRAPKWQGYAAANYKMPVSFGTIEVQGTFRFQSKTYYSETNQDTTQYLGKSWREVDLRLALNGHDSSWSLALFGRNILDQRYISQIVPYNGFPIATLNSPRSWGAAASFRF